MARIKDSSVEAVKSAAEILPLVEDYVRLRKTGGTYKGLCPFHQERTPSFIVTPARGTYKCFGCGEGGDAIAFVEKLEQVDFVGAIESLAKRFGVEIEYEEISPEAEQQRAPARAARAGARARHRVLRARAVGERARRVRARVPRVARARRGRVQEVPARLRARAAPTLSPARAAGGLRRARSCSPRGSRTAAATTTSRGGSLFPLTDARGARARLPGAQAARRRPRCRRSTSTRPRATSSRRATSSTGSTPRASRSRRRTARSSSRATPTCSRCARPGSSPSSRRWARH